MCETLQLNWKLPTTPVETISSPLSAIKDNNNYTRLSTSVTRNHLSPNINKIESVKNNQTTVKKENLNNNRINATKEKNCTKRNQRSTVLKNSTTKVSNRKGADGKYVLRECSIKKRNEIEVKKSQPKKRGPKPRPKPMPMSKYRRRTANLRERERMGEINVAFEYLKDKIPTPLVTADSGKSSNSEKRNRCEKMTKINVLHIAISYIRALESILDTGDAGTQVYGTSIVQSPKLSVLNSLEDNIGLLKENENSSNNSQAHTSLKANVRNEAKSNLPLKDISSTGKYKRKSRKCISSQKCGPLTGKQNKLGQGTNIAVKKESKNELLFHANICEKLNQLQPVTPPILTANTLFPRNNTIKGGIMEGINDGIKKDGEKNVPDSRKYCPDWTELTPTLDFPPVIHNYKEENECNGSNGSNVVNASTFINAAYQEIKDDSDSKNTENDTPKPISTSDKFIEYSSVFNESNCSMDTSKPEKLRTVSFVSQTSEGSGEDDCSVLSKSDFLHTTNRHDSSLECKYAPQHFTLPPRGNLDTLLSSVATNQRQDKIKYGINEDCYSDSFAQRKLKTISKSGMNVLNCDLIFKTSVPWLNNSPSPPIFGRQPSFPDVFGAADDPDFLFGELTKSSLATEIGWKGDETQGNVAYPGSPVGFCSKSFSVSSGNGSVLSSEGSASSPEENDVTMMEYIDDTFQISI